MAPSPNISIDMSSNLPLPSSASRAYRSPYRRRRILWFAVLLTVFALFYLTPPGFWDTRRAQAIADTVKSWTPDINSGQKQQGSYNAEDELRDLLHMVASSELKIPNDVDPSKPLDRSVYTAGLEDVMWLQEPLLDPPVIVFSKTYCQYSKKAKELLESYDLSPPPKIVEVDLRDDSELLKTLLTRLSHHSTFPNIFIERQSIGGWDDLERLQKDGQLITRLSSAGVTTQSKED